MILLIDSRDNLCKVSIVNNCNRIDDEWLSGKNLAKGLLKHLNELLDENKYQWTDINYIGVFTGPGSFTGLRIGATVANTLADSLNIPIVGTFGENWQSDAINRLKNAENDKIVLPNYGSDAKITTPKK